MSTKLIELNTTELQSIEQSKADQIKAVFGPMAEMLKSFEDGYNEIVFQSEEEITKDITAKAKRLRLDIGKIRIETEKVRKQQKEEYLRAGKAIDGVSNILKWAISDKEDRLKEIENYFEIQEKMRLDELQNERSARISVYVEDAISRDWTKFTEDEFNSLVLMKKIEKEERIAAERKAEEERIAKELEAEKERDRIREENERLKKEADAREQDIRIEAKKREEEDNKRRENERLERQEREEKERIERELYEQKINDERLERQRVEQEEREKRKKLEDEIKAIQEEERKAKELEEARTQAELNKGDLDKVEDMIADIKAIQAKYSFKSAKNKKMYSDVCVLLGKVILHIQK